MSSLQLLFSEDVDSNGLATAALPIKGNIVVPRWDILMPQCSSEPMIIEAVPPPSHLGKYSHFARALFICSSLYLRASLSFWLANSESRCCLSSFCSESIS